jgi:hypothetical protein
MSVGCAEQDQVHTRLLKCALEEDEARAYWASHTPELTAALAFERYTFGAAKSMPRVEVLLSTMRARFDAFPHALSVLKRWPHMSPRTRRVICHWHLQLSDPLYRRFTGEYLVQRHSAAVPEVYRELIVSWVERQGQGRWTISTRVQFASKLLSAAHDAGLVTTTRDPRPVAYPAVPDDALEYLLYTLRAVRFEGTLLDNLYLRSVGLADEALDERLRALPALNFSRQGALLDLGWRYETLGDWCSARVAPEVS